jgi:hypothetical protein
MRGKPPARPRLFIAGVRELRAIEVEADRLFVERAPRDFERIEDRGDVAAAFRQGSGDQRAFIGRDAGGEGAVSVEDGSVDNLG